MYQNLPLYQEKVKHVSKFACVSRVSETCIKFAYMSRVIIETRIVFTKSKSDMYQHVPFASTNQEK